MYFIEYNRLVLEGPNIYQDWGDSTRMRVLVFRALSDSEELVGDNLTGELEKWCLPILRDIDTAK